MDKIFSRTGSKHHYKKQIVELIPKHTTYTEVFFGSGAIFFAKDKVDKEIINDLDKDLMNDFKFVKKMPKQKVRYDAKSVDLIALIKTDDKDLTKMEQLHKKIIMRNNGYRSIMVKKFKIYTQHTHHKKMNSINAYIARFKKVKILTQDYAKVLKKYDDPEAFHFIDPPYENSDKLYKHSMIDYEKMNKLLKSLKGKFLLTLNDSPEIRRVFKGFEITPFHHAYMGGRNKARDEVFITNYKSRSVGRQNKHPYPAKNPVKPLSFSKKTSEMPNP